MFYVAGRKVRIVTGTHTQTINICTANNTIGVYDYILRLRQLFVAEDVLRQQQFETILQLINYLIENYNAKIEKLPTKEPTPTFSDTRKIDSGRTEQKNTNTFKEDILNRLWTYQRKFFPEMENYFDRSFATVDRPPVFLEHKAWNNILYNPDTSQEEINRLIGLMPKGET